MDATEERPRTTAIGLLTDAKDMLLAASILHDSDKEWKVQGPTYYLLGHATELALKSFLLANGDSLDRLRQRIGHNLAKAARRVRATKCDPLAQTVADNFEVIELLNFYYEAKEFEYRVTGLKSYPKKELLFEFLRTAIPMIEPHAMRVYPGR